MTSKRYSAGPSWAGPDASMISQPASEQYLPAFSLLPEAAMFRKSCSDMSSASRCWPCLPGRVLWVICHAKEPPATVPKDISYIRAPRCASGCSCCKASLSATPVVHSVVVCAFLLWSQREQLNAAQHAPLGGHVSNTGALQPVLPLRCSPYLCKLVAAVCLRQT